jgi:VIT1/CCC1 family predicted Fe2+/Mn2+ transporter
MAILALAVLGIAKAKIAGQNYVLSVFITVGNGAFAAAAAYAIGWTLRNVAGLVD